MKLILHKHVNPLTLGNVSTYNNIEYRNMYNLCLPAKWNDKETSEVGLRYILMGPLPNPIITSIDDDKNIMYQYKQVIMKKYLNQKQKHNHEKNACYHCSQHSRLCRWQTKHSHLSMIRKMYKLINIKYCLQSSLF
jgi:hypothetical protein